MTFDNRLFSFPDCRHTGNHYCTLQFGLLGSGGAVLVHSLDNKS